MGMLEDLQRRRQMGGQIMPSVEQRPQAKSLLDIARQGTANFMDYQPNNQPVSVGDIARFGVNATPFVGDAVAIEDAKNEYQKGNMGMAAFNAATSLPLIGDVAALGKLALPAAASLGGLYGMMRQGAKSLPEATGAISKQRGIIGGVNAKTADLKALENAQEMTANGIDRGQIWNDTGWFKGVDDKWRFEIDDSQAKLLDVREGNDLKDTLQHYKAYRNYDIGDARFRERAGEGASYARQEGMVLGDERISDDFDEITVGRDQNPETYKSAAIHESQHAIQNNEGFARGGNPEMFESPHGAAKARINLLNREKGRLAKEIDNASISYGVPKKGQEKHLAELRAEYQATQIEKERIWDAATKSPFEQYQALAGEAEARAVQTRMNLTPDQRAVRPFWQDYDVPESEQIVRFK